VKRVAIFGSGGQLGVELKARLQASGYQVAAFERTTVDITDQAGVEHTLAEFDPALVFNAAAYNQVDVAENEPHAAFQVNALAVRNLALACRQVDAKLIHFSTDYVFDGLAGRAYTEQDETHPLGAYAVSKLAGELYARAYLDQVLIIRTSGVYGPGGLHTARGNFVELMLPSASPFAWWRITSHRPPSRRRWPRARSNWWSGASAASSTRAAVRRSPGSIGR
jgi:dTDP-4-dehydrorhamnose reductase